MTLPEAIRAAQSDPGVAIRRADHIGPPLRWTGVEWQAPIASRWGDYFDDVAEFNEEDVLADWDVIPVSEIEATERAR